MADTETTPWYKSLTPKEIVLALAFLAGVFGYDASVTAPRFEKGREALKEAQKQIGDLERMIEELKKGQDKQLEALGVKR